MGREEIDDGLSALESEHEMDRRSLLDTVIVYSLRVFQQLTVKDQPLRIRRNSFRILNLLLEVEHGVGSLRLDLSCLTNYCAYRQSCRSRASTRLTACDGHFEILFILPVQIFDELSIQFRQLQLEFRVRLDVRESSVTK